jgi:hypothetical protein
MLVFPPDIKARLGLLEAFSVQLSAISKRGSKLIACMDSAES